MKSVISAAVIFIFIIITGIISTIYVNSTTDEMLQFVYKNEIYFSNSMWEEAENETKKLEDMWAKKSTLLSVFLNHSILNDVDTNIAKLKNATKNRKNSDFFYESDSLVSTLLNIKEQQKISIENIF